jgi:hypothetical protein
LIVEDRQGLGQRVQRAVDHRFLRRELAGQLVDAVGGRDDVVGLLVDSGGEGLQLTEQGAQLVLPLPAEGGVQCRRDVLNIADAAAVEQQ